MNIEKLESLYVDTVNKALTATEAMTDLNAKSMSYANIAQALAMVIAGQSNNAVKVEDNINCKTKNEEQIVKIEIKEEAAATSTSAPASATDKWIPPVDENGIPYLPDEYKSDGKKLIAWRIAMKDPEVKEKIAELDKKKAKEILEETSKKAEEVKEIETPKEVVKETETKEVKGPRKPLTKKQTKDKVEEKFVVSKETLDKFEKYKDAFDYNNEPNKLNALLHNFTSGEISDVKNITDKIIEPFILFLDKEFNELFDKLDNYKTNYGEEYLNSLLNSYYGEEDDKYNIETNVGYDNIIEFIEYLDKLFANYYLDIYINGDENGEYKLELSLLNKFAIDLFGNTEATVDWINDENVIAYIDLINQSFEEE